MTRRAYSGGMFFLTFRELLVIVLVMGALIVGAGVRHSRLSARIPAEAR